MARTEGWQTRQFVQLDRLKVGARRRVGATVMNSMRASKMSEVITGNLLVTLEAEVLAEKLVGDQAVATLDVPASWFQHLKRDQWYINLHRDRVMRWVANRWPVQYRTLTVTVPFERYAKFPHATIAMPELGAPVIFERWGDPTWDALP